MDIIGSRIDMWCGRGGRAQSRREEAGDKGNQACAAAATTASTTLVIDDDDHEEIAVDAMQAGFDEMDEVSGSGSAEFLDNGSLEIEFAGSRRRGRSSRPNGRVPAAC